MLDQMFYDQVADPLAKYITPYISEYLSHRTLIPVCLSGFAFKKYLSKTKHIFRTHLVKLLKRIIWYFLRWCLRFKSEVNPLAKAMAGVGIYLAAKIILSF